MNKATWIKIAQICVVAIPPVAVLCIKFPDFIRSTSTTISAAGLLVAIILICIFKDQTKKYFQSPSAFKICLVAFILSLIAVNLGEQLLVISTTAMLSGACGVPLDMWYRYLTKEASNDEILDALKGLSKEKTEDENKPTEKP